MPQDILDLPLMGREAVVRDDTIDEAARTIDIVWTTGATVQRVRREGWDTRIEYDETLEVSPQALRLDRLNDGAPFLDSHSSWGGVSTVLGAVVPGSVRIENGQGTAKIRLTSAPDAASKIHRILERTISKVSVGYRVHRYEITKPERREDREQWRAVDWEPYEISAVAMPADPGASIRSDQSGHGSRNPCVIVTQKSPTAAAVTTSKGPGMPDTTIPAGADNARATGTTPSPPVAQPSAPPPAAPDADAIRAEERTRVSTIMTLCARHGLDAAFQNDLVARGVSLADAREAVLDALVERDTAGRTVELAPAQVRGNGDSAYRNAMTEALLHRASPGAGEISRDAREFRSLSLMELARHALERSGTRTAGMSKMELAGAALSQRAGVGYHATGDFPAILANVANRTLRDAYAATPRTFAAWARRATITDFRPVQRTQLGGAPDLQKVLESGEFQYGTIGEGKEVYALASYGRIIAFTRQSLINDDLDAFARVPAAFGASAADLESDIVYSILTANPNMADGTALFHGTHGNLGTAAVISETALAAAWRAFGQQKGLEDRLISILPRFILVPPGTRAVEARKQVTATTPSNAADVNTFSGRLEVIEEPRLIPSVGEDPWFLAADPARIDTVEYAYLDGQEGVFTETRMGFEVDGIEIKVRHDFAAKAIDWRGLYKNPGLAPS